MMKTTLFDRAVIRLSGEDVRGFLQGLVTNDTSGPLPVWAGLLSPQGKALFDFILWADHDDVLIDCEAVQADALIKRLTMYRLRRAITIARDTGVTVNWSITAPDAIDACLDPRLPALGWRWLALADGEDASMDWRAHRLSLGVAEGVAELGQDKNLWLEANAAELNGVSFSKGCYVGQENTARMNYRSKVNRRLFVTADGGVERRAVAAPGDALIPEWLKTAIG
jgi:tRNA-modifying protein YgfZ